MWRANDPQGNEAGKVKYDIVPFTRGRGLDLGCGPHKAFEHFIGVDNGHHAKMFGWDIRPDVHVDTCEDLGIFADESVDFIFSSHLLEHIEDTHATLTEWFRVIKVSGYLVLYLPHADLYPNIGQPGANPDHKHDFKPEHIIGAMKSVGGWDLLREEFRDYDHGPGDPRNEYSFLLVFKKRADRKRVYPCRDLKKDDRKRVLVIRYGAYGDILQAASVLPYLKEAGYHITFNTVPNGINAIGKDPHVDNWLVQDPGQVPHNELGPYWESISRGFDKVINFSETVEGSLLAIPTSSSFYWTKEGRHAVMNENYMERYHKLAGVPLSPKMKFYYSGEEGASAEKMLDVVGRENQIVMWVMRGSSEHKFGHYHDQVIARTLMTRQNVKFILVGDHTSRFLSGGWEHEDRVIDAVNTTGWNIRQVMLFAQFCDVVIGPETGVLNCVAQNSDVAKVVMLSHSTAENLTKHWDFTIALQPSIEDVPCWPCHQLHYKWNTCNKFHYTEAFCQEHGISTRGGLLEQNERGETVHVARCQAHIFPDQIEDALLTQMDIQLGRKEEPAIYGHIR